MRSPNQPGIVSLVLLVLTSSSVPAVLVLGALFVHAFRSWWRRKEMSEKFIPNAVSVCSAGISILVLSFLSICPLLATDDWLRANVPTIIKSSSLVLVVPAMTLTVSLFNKLPRLRRRRK